MHRRPAGQRDQQAEQAADREENNRDDGVRLDEFFGSAGLLAGRWSGRYEILLLSHVSAPLLDDVDLANHHVVADPAKFVTNNAILAGLVGLDRHDQVVTRVYLDVDVDGLQRKAVLPVHGRQVQSVALIFLEFQNRPPLPQPAIR